MRNREPEERGARVSDAVGVEPLRGALYQTFVRCGKPNCRCARGQLHGPYHQHIWFEHGRRRKRYVPPRDVADVRAAISLWRRMHPPARAMRKELARLERLSKELAMTEKQNPAIFEEAIPEAPEGAYADHPITKEIAAFEKRSRDAKESAQAMVRASAGWALVKRDEDFVAIAEQAQRDYDNGDFLLAQLGGQACVDPAMTATLLNLRRRLIADRPGCTAQEEMLIDCELLAYHNAMRVQRWSNDLSYSIEREFFGLAAPSQDFRHRRELADGLTVEEHLRRAREQLLPLFDRSTGTMIRIMTAANKLRLGPGPAVSVGHADQVNVAGAKRNGHC